MQERKGHVCRCAHLWTGFSPEEKQVIKDGEVGYQMLQLQYNLHHLAHVPRFEIERCSIRPVPHPTTLVTKPTFLVAYKYCGGTVDALWRLRFSDTYGYQYHTYIDCNYNTTHSRKDIKLLILILRKAVKLYLHFASYSYIPIPKQSPPHLFRSGSEDCSNRPCKWRFAFCKFESGTVTVRSKISQQISSDCIGRYSRQVWLGDEICRAPLSWIDGYCK